MCHFLLKKLKIIQAYKHDIDDYNKKKLIGSFLKTRQLNYIK